jgi:hypothetical protein
MALHARRSVNGATWRHATETLRRCYEAACEIAPSGARTAVLAKPSTPDRNPADTTGHRQLIT